MGENSKIDFFQFFHFKLCFDFHVVVAQKINPLEGALYGKNHHISAPPIHKLFDLQQHNVPQKITFSMKIYDYENEIIV